MINKRVRSWNEHLKRISPFLLPVKGIWWESSQGKVTLNDSDVDTQAEPSKPPMLHFRSASIKDVVARQRLSWEEVMAKKVEIPTTKLHIYSDDGVLQRVQTYLLNEGRPSLRSTQPQEHEPTNSFLEPEQAQTPTSLTLLSQGPEQAHGSTSLTTPPQEPEQAHGSTSLTTPPQEPGQAHGSTSLTTPPQEPGQAHGSTSLPTPPQEPEQAHCSTSLPTPPQEPEQVYGSTSLTTPPQEPGQAHGSTSLPTPPQEPEQAHCSTSLPTPPQEPEQVYGSTSLTTPPQEPEQAQAPTSLDTHHGDCDLIPETELQLVVEDDSSVKLMTRHGRAIAKLLGTTEKVTVFDNLRFRLKSSIHKPSAEMRQMHESLLAELQAQIQLEKSELIGKIKRMEASHIYTHNCLPTDKSLSYKQLLNRYSLAQKLLATWKISF